MSTGAESEFNAPYFQAVKPGKSFYVNITNSSVQSPEFEQRPDATNEDLTVDNTTLISVFATQDCWVSLGTNPTAAAGSTSKGNSMFLPGGIKDFLGVKPGWKIAVVRDTTDGLLHINECKS